MKFRMITMTALIVSSMATLAFTKPVCAQSTNYPDMYVGLKFGNAKADFGAATKVYNTNLGVAATDKDDKGNFNTLFGGVRLNENFGVEVALAGANDFGSTDKSSLGSVRAKTYASFVIADAVGYVPLSTDISLYGKVGVAFTRTYAESVLNGTALLSTGEKSKHESSKTAAHFGLGVSYLVARNVDLRLEVDRISKVGAASGSNITGTSGITAVTVGVGYHF